MASGPISSWQINGETVEIVADFIFGGSKITADGDCSHEIKRYLLLGRKVMTNLDSIFKSRDIPLPTKVHLVKAMVFPVVMYGCESWTIKKAESEIEVKVKSLSRVQLLGTPWTAAHQAPPSMGFSRQEYWSGVPLPSPMTNLDSILKNRDITLPTNVHFIKAMVFPVVMHGCESWTIKKAEC